MTIAFNRLVLWGLRDSVRDLHHIGAGFKHAAQRLGIEVVWVNDDLEGIPAVGPGSLVWAYDGACEHLPSVPGARYLMHNLSTEQLERLPDDSWLRYQVYTDDLPFTECEQLGLFSYLHRQGRVLFQPWGTDRLPDEHLDPVWSGHSSVVNWVGSVWDNELRQGNERMVAEFRTVLAERDLSFEQRQLMSPHDGIALVRASRIAPALAGEWQVEHNYLPCRYFKNISYGHLGVTNVTRFRDLMGDTFVEGDTIAELVDAALSMGSDEYLARTRAQQELVAPYNYARKLEDVSRIFEEYA